MVFLFIFLLVFMIFFCILIFSKIRIEIINFRFTSMNKKHLNENYKIIIKLRIFNKFTIFKIILTKNKLKNLNLKQDAKIIRTKIIENKIDKRVFKIIKNIKIIIKRLNLSIDIGTEDASLTALLVAIISSITGVIFRKSIIDSKKQIFKIVPVYVNKNLININVSGIFEIKMIHIINIIYILNKKEGVKYNERTSNRRAYDYSYE